MPTRSSCLCATEHLDFHDTGLLRLERFHHLSHVDMVFTDWSLEPALPAPWSTHHVDCFGWQHVSEVKTIVQEIYWRCTSKEEQGVSRGYTREAETQAPTPTPTPTQVHTGNDCFRHHGHASATQNRSTNSTQRKRTIATIHATQPRLAQHVPQQKPTCWGGSANRIVALVDACRRRHCWRHSMVEFGVNLGHAETHVETQFDVRDLKATSPSSSQLTNNLPSNCSVPIQHHSIATTKTYHHGYWRK